MTSAGALHPISGVARRQEAGWVPKRQQLLKWKRLEQKHIKSLWLLPGAHLVCQQRQVAAHQDGTPRMCVPHRAYLVWSGPRLARLGRVWGTNAPSGTRCLLLSLSCSGLSRAGVGS